MTSGSTHQAASTQLQNPLAKLPYRYVVILLYQLNKFCKILKMFVYGCETWSLTLREERRLRVFENRVLRGILGHKRDEVSGEWRKLNIEEFNALYSSPNIVRVMKSRMRWVGHVARMGEERRIKGFGGKT
jgi:hypothetical protein